MEIVKVQVGFPANKMHRFTAIVTEFWQPPNSIIYIYTLYTLKKKTSTHRQTSHRFIMCISMTILTNEMFQIRWQKQKNDVTHQKHCRFRNGTHLERINGFHGFLDSNTSGEHTSQLYPQQAIERFCAYLPGWIAFFFCALRVCCHFLGERCSGSML